MVFKNKMKKKLSLLLVSLQASTLSILEGIGLLEKNSEMSTSDKLKMLLVRLIFLPLRLLLFLSAITVALIATIVFFVVSLFRMHSLRRALWMMTIQSTTKAYELVLTKLYPKRPTK